MKITDLPFAVLRLQYRLARVPLQLIEQRFVARMDAEAPPRLYFERAVGTVDAAAGSLLRDAKLEESGINRIEKAAVLGEAARLDDLAAQQKQQAEDELAERRERAASAPEEARQEAQERISEARLTAEQRKQQTAQEAAVRAEQAKKQVDDAAEQKVAAVEKTRRNVENRSRAVENTKVSAAKEELEDAADKQRTAGKARQHAERLDELSDVEKEKRQANT
ncbi:IF2 family translation initiation factor [Mycobacterium sp. SMC-4]|uniref:IF2 family translation initiation factor n=1 Tax=Mycobacterium sp. SMC-4 TaxID=2857059 RepID=UPI003D0851ED